MAKKFEQDTVMHLYENAHSGFYGDESSATVDLLPKTWTRYTVTDGDWMQKETIEPLVNRDIYLANKIDELDEYFGNLYSAGKHISIDRKTNTISVNPYEYKYIFNHGLLYDEYDVYSDLPEMYGGIENKLEVGDDGITYGIIPGETESGLTPDSIIQISASGGLTEESVQEFPAGANIVIVSSSQLEYDDRFYDCGGYKIGSANYWDFEQNRRVYENYDEDPPVPTGDDTTSGTETNIFDPSDRRIYNSSTYSGGKNYIEWVPGPGGITVKSMLPYGVLYIYE